MNAEVCFRVLKKIAVGITVVFVTLQFFRPDRPPLPTSSQEDLITVHPPPPGVRETLVSACYDCHSNQTRYPWYASIQPVAWFLDHHVEEGRMHINFSEFGGLPPRRALQVLEACGDEVAEKGMPLWSYTLAHPEARLTEAQRADLVAWVTKLADESRQKLSKPEPIP
ncbi:MAG: heme-binding domain-containing protein [Nibricoccus sp.]